ncbi:nucleoside hydrolase [Microbacterium sediminis]|uniref:Nucleoside hydrolase n=1 Tax=Microbacterium sediminis TaxID=904291 RepID=A0A1B9NB99_9MICO|nr:nucleoside hydrolase [Microbacterium sediminis]OCG73857.1 nucleoside hydrolase [Microbacterium sediminis]QBR74603.1 nucleoside hydrolase [Microbacterium sediminis]
MSTPFILDTDTAQDDCVAILVGLLDPAADLRAITMVAGNVGFAQQVRNAWMTLNVADRLDAVPIFLGAQRPLMREWVSAENVHGDGSGGLSIDDSGLEAQAENAVDAMLRITAEQPGEVSIVAIGPLTNVALAAIRDPEFPKRVKSLYIMGGSNNGRGNITAAAEFNFYVDPEAARTVFEAGFADVVVVPWAPLTLRDAVFTKDRIAQLAGIGTPLARFVERVCRGTLAFDESVGIPGSTHPDSLTAALLLHPELITAEAPYAVDIETSSELTRGYSAMSWGVHGLEPNARVIEAVDGDAFFRYICDLVSQLTQPPRPFTPAL